MTNAEKKEEMEFPSLFTNEELDEKFSADQSANKGPSEAYHPLPILEQHYPRIAEIVQGLWGTPELDNYFDKLLIDERGNRAGFPTDVVKALLALSRQHLEQFKLRSPDDIWTLDPNVTKSKF